MRRTWIASLLIGFSMIPPMVSLALAQANFYEGKTVILVIGAKGAGSLIAATQIVSHHLGKYIPGNPAVIVQEMPGAAHLLATNQIFNVAKPDGLTILAANPQVAVAQLAKVEQVRFDVRKFHWLGSSGPDGVALSVRADLPYKNFEDIRKADHDLIVGTTGPGSNAHDFPLLLKEFAGAKFKLVSGYPSNGDVQLALQRKEVDVWAALATTI
jgi:tripartite-type tricarboxylate transporter receptor subunit TctC